MTPEQKLIVGTSLLPVLADFIEDYPMKQLAKAQRNAIVKAIRHYDAFYMDGAPIDVVDQQANIQLWFRQMLDEQFEEI
jgi:ribonucleotide reductase alpha subunit